MENNFKENPHCIASAMLFDGVMYTGRWHGEIKKQYLGDAGELKRRPCEERGFLLSTGEFMADMPNRKEIHKAERYGYIVDPNDCRWFSAAMFDTNPELLDLELAQTLANEYNRTKELELLEKLNAPGIAPKIAEKLKKDLSKRKEIQEYCKAQNSKSKKDPIQ